MTDVLGSLWCRAAPSAPQSPFISRWYEFLPSVPSHMDVNLIGTIYSGVLYTEWPPPEMAPPRHLHPAPLVILLICWAGASTAGPLPPNQRNQRKPTNLGALQCTDLEEPLAPRVRAMCLDLIPVPVPSLCPKAVVGRMARCPLGAFRSSVPVPHLLRRPPCKAPPPHHRGLQYRAHGATLTCAHRDLGPQAAELLGTDLV